MSFDSLKKDELLDVAEKFGVDVRSSDNKATIVAALVEDGVTWEQAKAFDENVAEKDEELAEEAVASEDTQEEAEESEKEQALVLMTRRNYVFEVMGIRFTSKHPFALVDADKAERLVENVEGFRYATPKEAREYYG